MCQKKSHQRMFGPVAVVASGRVRLGEECAVAAVPCFEEGDVRIRVALVSAFCGEPDEWIIERMENHSYTAVPVLTPGAGEPWISVERNSSA